MSSSSSQPIKNKLSSEFSQTQLADFTDAFCLFNPEANGQIKICELEVALRSMGHTTFTEELKDLFKSEITVDIYEFLYLIETWATPSICESDIRAAFLQFNAEGFVDIKIVEFLSEFLSEAWSNLEPKDIKENIKEIIDALTETPMEYEYFVKWMACPSMRVQLQLQLKEQLEQQLVSDTTDCSDGQYSEK